MGAVYYELLLRISAIYYLLHPTYKPLTVPKISQLFKTSIFKHKIIFFEKWLIPLLDFTSLRKMKTLRVFATAMVDSTDTARGPLMPTTEAMAMAVLATAMVLTAMASNSTFVNKICQPNLKAKRKWYSKSLN